MVTILILMAKEKKLPCLSTAIVYLHQLLVLGLLKQVDF